MTMNEDTTQYIESNTTRWLPARTPNAPWHYHGDISILRALVSETGLTHRQIAARLGITERALRYYRAGRRYPYTVQFALECLANRLV